jgi:hypothetical protein
MNNKREKYIHFRVTRNEKQALEVLATHEGRSPSEMMREILRDAVSKRGLGQLFSSNRSGELITDI